MKKTFRVSQTVVIEANSEAALDAAIADLLKDPPYRTFIKTVRSDSYTMSTTEDAACELIEEEK